MLGLRFRLRPATPGRVVGVCVCLCARSACSPPLLAGLGGVVVCARTRDFAAPRHSWLLCWGVCVFVCALRLHPSTAGWGVRCGSVCLGSGFGCATPLLAGVLACVCVLVCVLCLYPATPGWGMRCGCVCLGSGFGCATPLLGGVLACVCVFVTRSACTPPLLAGVCGVRVCAWARISAAPRHSSLRYWGVSVFVCVLRLYPSTPGWGVRCECVCSDSGFVCALPVLAWVLGCVCVCVRAQLVPCHCWLGLAVSVCVLGLGFGFATPLLALVLGCVCVCVRALLVTRHSWLGRAVWVCVFRLEFGLRPAAPSLRVGVCVRLCARSACTPPLLAGVCGVVACAWARVSTAPSSPR